MADTNTIGGYAGKILRVNLSNGQISTEPIWCYAKDWLGSSGLAIKVLYDELKSWVSPYDPANKIVLGAGVLQGTPAPGASKMTASTLGPMTGGWATGASDSYVGGQLKYAGYDAVIIEGKAHKPVYLWIKNENVEIREASQLWGSTTWRTFEILKDVLGDTNLHIISIGPAGENLVRGACIIQDKGRAFGRCGTGAVMGSKNLKAVAVKGTGTIQVADPKRFMASASSYRKRIMSSNRASQMKQYGILYILKRKQDLCGMIYKNFQDCRVPDEMADAIEPKRTIDKYRVGNSSFPGCAIACGQMLHFTDGPYAGLTTESCQWEALSTLQTRLGIWEPHFMFKANAFCNEMGLDIDAAGGAIGWAMECYQRGIIDEKDTDGLILRWGDANVVLELIKKISYRNGFGNILAEGCSRAAEIIGRGSSYYAINIKGQDLYEPCRGANAWALGTTTSTRGGGHTTGATVLEASAFGGGVDLEKAAQIYGVEGIDRVLEYEGKAEIVVFMEALSRVANSLGICHYHTVWADIDYMSLTELAELYSAATGWETSEQELKRVAERQLNLEKAFNLRYTNFDRKDDLPTQRDLSEPIPTGTFAGWKIDENLYNKMLDEYYELHGWEKRTSYPSREVLEDLGLKYVADELQEFGKLGRRYY